MMGAIRHNIKKPPLTKVFNIQACDEGASALIIHHHDDAYLFDCWLSPKYFALHPKFYLGKRVSPTWFDFTNLPDLRGLFLSSKQNDHSDPVTLKNICKKNSDIPIWASSSLTSKLKKIQFNNIHPCKAGVLITISAKLRAMRLNGYGGCSPFLFQDIPSKQTICIAPHSIHFAWLKAHWHIICRQFELSDNQTLLSTLFIGITPTILNPFGLFPWIMPQRGINIPLPNDTLRLFRFLKPEKIIPIHQTPELRTGWAVKHLVKFPYAPMPKSNQYAVDIGSTITLQWLSRHYDNGSFIYPKLEPIIC